MLFYPLTVQREPPKKNDSGIVASDDIGEESAEEELMVGLYAQKDAFRFSSRVAYHDQSH